MKANRLTIEAYSSGVTRLPDPTTQLAKASGAEFSTGYSGGLYLTGSFYVPRDITDWWGLKGAQRVIMRDGLKVVYEGYIDGFDHTAGMGAQQGTRVLLTGAWDKVGMRRRLLKIWSDNRVEDEIWRLSPTADLEDYQVDRTGRIHITPNAGSFTSADALAARYAAPVGETIKRITCHEDFAEKAGQDWKMSIWRSTDASSWTEMTNASGETYADGTTTVLSATGNDDIDVTLATPSRYIELRLTSLGNNDVSNRDHNHAQWTNLVVYSETSAINLTEVAKDVVGAVDVINADVSHIGSNTLDLTPFWSANETLADLLTGAASFGDSDGDRWAVGFLHSETAATPDGKPVLYVEQYPALTDYDYALRLDETCLAGPVSLAQDFSDIDNNIVVEFQDINGWGSYVTPTDQATLTDAASIAAYGQRDQHINVGYSTAAVALDNGERYLAAHKDPQWVVEQPISVYWIRRKAGDTIPASHITAGKRLKIENYATNQAGGGTGLTVLITGTQYDDDSQVCTMTFGRPEGRLLVGMMAPVRVGEELPESADTGASTSPGRLNWKRRIGLKPGTPEWERASKATPAEKAAMIAEWKARKRRG